MKNIANNNDKITGLGDVVAAVTHVTGLDKVAEKYTELTGKDCGCKARQEQLNRLFPFKSGTFETKE